MEGLELYRLFFEEASDAFFAAQLPEGHLFSVNKAFEALTGYSREELEGEALSVLNPMLDEDNGRERRLDNSILNTPGFYNDVALATRDGQTRYVTAKVRHIAQGPRRIALVVLSDDTERQLMLRDLTTKHQSLEMAYVDLERMHREMKNTQEQMSQAAKLVALGEVAAGMSHELNQPLTGIRGFAQEILDLQRSEKSSKLETRKYCEEIISNADKMAGLLSQFRDFARSDTKVGEKAAPPEPFALKGPIEAVLMLLGSQFARQQIKVDLKGLDAEVHAMGHGTRFEQILINLLTNARDAILEKQKSNGHEGGRILIRVTSEDGFVCMRVSDNGSGVPEGVKARIFDPFVTTKDPGKGLGLGLSISFGIAHSFGGQLILEDTGPRGSTFALKLKGAEAKTKAAPAASAKTAPSASAKTAPAARGRKRAA